MKKKAFLYILAFCLIILGIVYLIVKYGAGPKFITVFKASGFNEPAQIGAVVERRLFIDIRKSPALLFGIQESDPNHTEVINGFLQVLASEGGVQPVVIYDKDFLNIAKIQKSETQFSFSSEMGALAEHINQIQLIGKKPILITRTHYSSHLMHNGLMMQLEDILKKPVTSITMLSVVLKPQHENQLLIPCIGSREEGATFGQLGCVAVTKSRTLYQMRKPIPERFISTLEKSGANDFILFVGEKK